MVSKLIRDNIPSIIASRGDTARTHVATEMEYTIALKQKLEEEVQEYLASENPEELADIIEVVFALAESKKTSLEDLELMRKKKADKNGQFKKRIILDTIT